VKNPVFGVSLVARLLQRRVAPSMVGENMQCSFTVLIVHTSKRWLIGKSGMTIELRGKRKEVWDTRVAGTLQTIGVRKGVCFTGGGSKTNRGPMKKQ